MLEHLLTKNEKIQKTLEYIEYPERLIEDYYKVVDLTRGGEVPYKLFPRQLDIVNALKNHRHNLITKPRQAGVSTTVAAFMTTQIVLSSTKRPEKILIIANKLRMAKEFLKKIRSFAAYIPRYLWGDNFDEAKKTEGYLVGKGSTEKLVFQNGCEVVAVATSEDALRGYTPTYLVVDEAAFIEHGDELYGAAMSSLITGGKMILVSTPNGFDKLYYRTYKNALAGDNNFNIVELQWYQDPRYNKGMYWIKEDPKTKEITQIEETEFTQTSFDKKIEQGYRARSPWYNEMCANLNHDKLQIARELDVMFEGSAGNVVEYEALKVQKAKYIKEPIKHDIENKLVNIYKDPNPNCSYVMGVDVSSGNSDDYSSMTVIEVESGDIVLSYKEKVRPEYMAVLAERWGRIYDALIVVDVTGGYGDICIHHLELREYEKIYYRDVLTYNTQAQREENRKKAGIQIKSSRSQMIGTFVRYVETFQLKLSDPKILEELDTFVYVNGRADHMDGYNDDLIWANIIAVWVIDREIRQVLNAQERDISVLSAMIAANTIMANDGKTNDTYIKKQKDKIVQTFGWGIRI